MARAALLLAARLGLLAHHQPDSRHGTGRGFPDLVLAGPGGVLFAECKGPREQLTLPQWTWRFQLLAAGLDHRIWRQDQWESGEIEAALRLLAAYP